MEKWNIPDGVNLYNASQLSMNGSQFNMCIQIIDSSDMFKVRNANNEINQTSW